jgi:drug/metabolite transporter (DMT)-like permease
MIVSGLHPSFYKNINQNITDLPIVLSLIFFITGLISFLYIFINYKSVINYINNNNNNNNSKLKYIFAIAIIILIFNLSISYAIKFSPNVCICLLIINLNIFIALIIDYLFFNYKFNIQTILGFIIATIGLSISIIYSKH